MNNFNKESVAQILDMLHRTVQAGRADFKTYELIRYWKRVYAEMSR